MGDVTPISHGAVQRQNEQITRLIEEIAVADAQAAQMRAERDAERALVADLHERLAAAHEQFSQADRRAADQRRRIEGLENRLADAHAANDALREAQKLTLARADRDSAAAADLRRQLAALEETLDRRCDQVRKLSKALLANAKALAAHLAEPPRRPNGVVVPFRDLPEAPCDV